MSGSGIPYADVAAAPKELVELIRARRANGALLNLDRMLLHSPGLARGWNGMFGAIRGQLSLPARLRELAIVAVGVLNGADYERCQHEPELLKAGGTEAQLVALRRLRRARPDARLFDAAERATLALAIEMTRHVKVRSATMRRLRALLPDAQVVELAGTIAGYNMVSRFVVATGVELEAD
jgi:alkylhydroperoxidase family enzyme